MVHISSAFQCMKWCWVEKYPFLGKVYKSIEHTYFPAAVGVWFSFYEGASSGGLWTQFWLPGDLRYRREWCWIRWRASCSWCLWQILQVCSRLTSLMSRHYTVSHRPFDHTLAHKPTHSSLREASCWFLFYKSFKWFLSLKAQEQKLIKVLKLSGGSIGL